MSMFMIQKNQQQVEDFMDDEDFKSFVGGGKVITARDDFIVTSQTTTRGEKGSGVHAGGRRHSGQASGEQFEFVDAWNRGAKNEASASLTKTTSETNVERKESSSALQRLKNRVRPQEDDDKSGADGFDSLFTTSSTSSKSTARAATSALADLVQLPKDNIGTKLLRHMGWREGYEVGAEAMRRRKKRGKRQRKLIMQCKSVGEGGAEGDERDKEEEEDDDDDDDENRQSGKEILDLFTYR